MLPHHPLVNGAMRRTKPTGSISTLRVICEPAMSGEPDRHPRLSGEASRSRRLLEIGEHNVARSSGFFEERGHLVDQLARLKAPRSPQCSKIERARLRQGRLSWVRRALHGRQNVTTRSARVIFNLPL